IEITDVTGVDLADPTAPVVSIRRTIYTRNYVPGASEGAVKKTTQLGTLDEEGNFVAAGQSVVTLGQNRTASYDPTQYLRYVWTEGTKYEQKSTYQIKGMTLFGSASLTVSAVSNMTSVGTPNLQSKGRLSDGTYLSASMTTIANET